MQAALGKIASEIDSLNAITLDSLKKSTIDSALHGIINANTQVGELRKTRFIEARGFLGILLDTKRDLEKLWRDLLNSLN
jgi:hypothetical protein